MTINFYRSVTTNELTSYGDTIAIEWDHFDTAIVHNITKNTRYTFAGEKGTVITDRENFPLTTTERLNLVKADLRSEWYA